MLSVGILSMVTGVISVAIVALGDLVNEIGEKAGVDRYRRANLMDCACWWWRLSADMAGRMKNK